MAEVADIKLTPTGDWAVSPTGDLALASGSAGTGAALLTRLLRSPGSLVWAPEYGGGLQDRLERPNTPAERGLVAQLGRANLLRDPRVGNARVVVAPHATKPHRVIVELSVSLRTGETLKTQGEV